MRREAKIRQATLLGLWINLGLVLFKFAAGICGASSALVADAAHSLSDLASDAIILICVTISGKPEDKDHAYGHGKFETLASVAIGLLLLGAGCALLWEGATAIISFASGARLDRPEPIALAAALISIITKEALYHYTMAAARKTGSDLLKANAWHHRSDALSSLATLAGIGGAMLLGGRWLILDPLAACLISLFIVWRALSLMRPGLGELAEKSLPPDEVALIEKTIAESPAVLGFHRVRTRRMGMRRAIEAHIKLDGAMTLKEAHDAATLVESRLKAVLGRETHIGIHMEPAKNGAPEETAAQAPQGADGK